MCGYGMWIDINSGESHTGMASFELCNFQNIALIK